MGHLYSGIQTYTSEGDWWHLQLGRGLQGTLGWSDGSFSLSQDDIDESADQRQREGHPRQDVGVAKGVCLHHPGRTHHRIDDGSAHHKQTCRKGKMNGE